MKAYKKGFTFIELIISSLILALILVSLYLAFNTGMFGYRHISDTLNISHSALKSIESINNDLRNSFAYRSERPGLSGTKNELEFFTLDDIFRQGAKNQDYVLVSYKLDNGLLLRSLRRNKDCLRDNASTQSSVLCRTVKDIEFSYAFFNQQTHLLEWKPEWQSNQTLPAAVKVALNLTGRRDPGQGFERTIYIPLSGQ